MSRRAVRKTILITGASSGLGEGLAREFAARGHDLALCARRVDRLETLAAELFRTHPGIRVVVRALDVTDAAAVSSVFHAFDKTLSGIDRVIVNAGCGGASPLGEGDVQAAIQVAQTNFVGAVAQCDAAMRLFRRQGHGHLVVLSSVSAVRGMPGGMATYSASKAAVAVLAEGIRNEMKARGLPIRVTTLMPGFIHTAINAHQMHKPFAVDVATGCSALAQAISQERDVAYVPGWPWWLLARVLRWLPPSRLPGARPSLNEAA
ncbi:MAG: SDR family oxidoreductase [Pseudomonadota bacterium]